MAGTVEQKLAEKGIVLNEPRTPMANYVGFVRSGNLLFVSGQVRPVIHARIPFSEAQSAHDLLESGEAFGKVLLVP